ncbi:MAG: CRISPR-associated endoribonuclease Cas6 [Scytolyngbya sp. HA4215-MV1]|jgi:CRISPR-associated endoribonuclease Cas6|nr:CRISPR-associated endoribonuclease Cas6 [Scytolyngbya sp. HA4215-MV1]
MAVSSRKPSKPQTTDRPALTWADNTELLALQLQLQPQTPIALTPQYTTHFHSWFLDQVRRTNPELSAYLHDGQSEKPFTLSSLNDPLQPQAHPLQLSAHQIYQWNITLLSPSVVSWLSHWLHAPPDTIDLRSGSFNILDWSLTQPPTTYEKLLPKTLTEPYTLTLSFLTPTSFRRKGNHLPLPLPTNVFQSYLRRWNDFSGETVDQDDFLDWVDETVVILRHHLQSTKVVVGKSSSVTGFTGSVQFGLTGKGKQDDAFVELWLALGQLAPYCGTGHKTTFGLGQTCLGWLDEPETAVPPSVKNLLAHRTAELTELFIAQRKRTGGDRATQIAETWATILARRELGESLQAIAKDLKMPYETVKTYAKLARRATQP